MSRTAQKDTRSGLRSWWNSPPPTGMERLLAPYVYRYAHFFGVARTAGGTMACLAWIICLGYGVFAWAAFFLVLAALNLAGGAWEVGIARAARSQNPPRT